MKFLLAILLFFSTIAVVAHGVMVYELTSNETIIAEEGTPESKSDVKEGKDISPEKISCSFYTFYSTQNSKLHKTALNKTLVSSKGFYDKPYNPPETA